MKMPPQNVDLAGGIHAATSGFYLFGHTARHVAAVSPAGEPSLGALAVEHAECSLFGPDRDRFMRNSLAGAKKKDFEYSRLTAEVVRQLPAVQASSSQPAREDAAANIIAKDLQQVWAANAVTPAARTTAYD